MKTRWSFRFVAASIAVLSFVALPGRARAQDANTISSRTAEVGGVTLHYLTAGHGPAVISTGAASKSRTTCRSRSSAA